MQTGLIMLIGLLAKTAILLTEYASERRKQGMSIVDAALDAAKVRLRPILMTSMTMVFGFAIMVGLQGAVADWTGNYMTSYVVVLACAAYILFYALVGSKNVNKDIPVE